MRIVLFSSIYILNKPVLLTHSPIHFNNRAIISKKKSRGGRLTLENIERNLCVSRDRVIVGNFFGRVSSLFGIIGGKYRWSRERVDTVVDFYYSLVNYHIGIHPLRDEDRVDYCCVLLGLRKRTEDIKSSDQKRQLRIRR